MKTKICPDISHENGNPAKTEPGNISVFNEYKKVHIKCNLARLWYSCLTFSATQTNHVQH